MLNAGEAVAGAAVDYASPALAEAMTKGRMNTDEATLLAHVESAIRRGHPQMHRWPTRPDRVCLVGSGPSLADTETELRTLAWEGARVVTLNGAYHWCLEHGIKPSAQIVMDARASNARFVSPAVPGCQYLVASQCASETWDAVAGRPNVWIWHAIVNGKDDSVSQALDRYYRGQWFGVSGGTTVATRALMLLRAAGYLRFDLFGVDCCWIGREHHAVAQPENDSDKDARMAVQVGDANRPDTMRTFVMSPWHVKQLEDFAQTIRVNGHLLHLAVHGDGALAYILRTLGDGETEIRPLTTVPEE